MCVGLFILRGRFTWEVARLTDFVICQLLWVTECQNHFRLILIYMHLHRPWIDKYCLSMYESICI